MRFELAPFDQEAGYADGVVSLGEMKAHLGIASGETEFDGIIGFYRDAAVDMVERYCGVRLAPCTGLTWRAEALCSPLDLGVWPVTDITAIAYLDSAGADGSGTATDWRVLQRDRIALKPSKDLPSDVAAGVVVTFDAGFTAANRPAALVQAVKLFAAHLYMNREAVSNGTMAGEIPLGFRQMCGAYRMPVI